jgi:hypothetical protein
VSRAVSGRWRYARSHRPLSRAVADAALAFEVWPRLTSGLHTLEVIRQHAGWVRPGPLFYDVAGNDPIRNTHRSRCSTRSTAPGRAFEERRIEGMRWHPGGSQFVTICAVACQVNWTLLTEHASISPGRALAARGRSVRRSHRTTSRPSACGGSCGDSMIAAKLIDADPVLSAAYADVCRSRAVHVSDRIGWQRSACPAQ